MNSNNSLVFRQRLEKELTFDNYKEKFDMLLHIEEIQMQKDIRNYDMKGVEFDQDGTDRRFLMLKVSENFACSMKTKCIPVRLPTAVYSCNL